MIQVHLCQPSKLAYTSTAAVAVMLLLSPPRPG